LDFEETIMLAQLLKVHNLHASSMMALLQLLAEKGVLSDKDMERFHELKKTWQEDMEGTAKAAATETKE
jgi:ribosome-associated protein YbcJ (S4-like RNA binding protein)